MKRKISTLTHWLREGKRLKRLEDVALVVDNEVQIFNYSLVQNSQLEKYLVPQNFLGWKIESSLNLTQYSSVPLARLPIIILEIICKFLTIQDITNLALVSHELYNSLMGTYVPLVALPLKTEYLGQIRKRRILRLYSCCYLPLMTGIETFQPFKQLNLSHLKELKIVGRNLDMGTRLCKNSQFCLGNTYLNSLEYILKNLSPISLQTVELLTDDTQECVEVYKNISRFYRLRKVILHGVSHWNSSAMYDSYDISFTQAIINEVLKLNIKELELVKFNVNDIHKNKIDIVSNTLETLTVIKSKTLSFKTVSLPNVLALNTDIGLLPCINNIRTLVYGCSKLKFWNGFDVEKLQLVDHFSSKRTCTDESNISRICLELGLHQYPILLTDYM